MAKEYPIANARKSANRGAILAKAGTYVADKPCVHGHDPVRYLSSKKCVGCAHDNNRTEAQRYRRMKHAYGLTREAHEAMLEAQEGRCALCREEKRLVIDHCHATNKVRALLCDSCNRALGFVKESTDLLRRMIAYLEQHGG